MKKRNEVPHQHQEGSGLNSYIQPSPEIPRQPAHVVQDGWIAYLPSGHYAKPSYEEKGRGFLRGKH